MSISSEIERINSNIGAAYASAYALGAEASEEENSANLARTIASIPSSGIPQAVVDGASNVVDKALSRGTGNVLRFITWSDAHQHNENEYITKGNKELGMAVGEIVKLIGVDFISSLGDNAWASYTNTTEEVKEQIKQLNRFVNPYIKGEQMLSCEGNHDDACYSLIDNDGDGTTPSTEKLSLTETYSLIYAKNKNVVYDADHWIDGYCYKDFDHLKVRVICLNTEQGDSDGAVMEGYQLKWFAETALDMTGKTDWNVITLAHHPLDWGSATLFKDCVNIVYAFTNGDNFSYTTQNGTAIAIDYSGKNCQYVGHFHGHTHAYCVLKMQRYVDGGYVDTDIYEIGIPNACYSRNNTNVSNTNERIQRFSTEITYNKSDTDGQRTSFNLVTVDLDNKIIYADNYGAGIDRVISYGVELATYTITRNLTNCTSSSTVETAIEANSHTETLTGVSGYTMDGAAVSVTMGGVDVTSSAYSNGTITIGSVTGDIVITASAYEIPVASYTNQLPISTDTDGSIYNSVGYKTDTYLSSGNVGSKSGSVTTGFIPIPETDSYELEQVVLYFENTELDATTTTRLCWYDADKKLCGSGTSYGSQWLTEAPTTLAGNKPYAIFTDGFVTRLDISQMTNYLRVTNSTPAYIRICGAGIDGESVITVNEPI